MRLGGIGINKRMNVDEIVYVRVIVNRERTMRNFQNGQIQCCQFIIS